MLETTGGILHLFLRSAAVFLSSLIFSAVHACFTYLQPHISISMGVCTCPCHQCHTQRWNCKASLKVALLCGTDLPAGVKTLFLGHMLHGPENLPQGPCPTKGRALFYSLRQNPEHLKILLECLLLKISQGLALGFKSSESKGHVFISCVCST